MCPHGYYTIMREVKEPKHLRLRMVLYAQQHGIKPAARAFQSTPKTVRKWLSRFDGTIRSLDSQSRAPHTTPRKLSAAAERKIVVLKRRLPRWSARRLKRDFGLRYSEKAIRRVCRDHGLNRRYRRRKHETKRCLRETKKAWRLFQQIGIDTKDLSDIPEYWERMQSYDLPRHQYTARDVTTGLLWLGYSTALSLSYADLFADRIIGHLQRCNVDLSRTTWQSDNGSEFIGSWQAKDDSAFTKSIERVPGQMHRTIPPGQHRFQADVETVHSLMEPEFYEIEPFASRQDFIAKAMTYQLYFNVGRRNSGKEDKTPWELVEQTVARDRRTADRRVTARADPRLGLLPPVYLDELLDQKLHATTPGGYDVWALP